MRHTQTFTLQTFNTFMFVSIMLWFVAQQNLLAPSSVKYGPADVTKAMHAQPRIPPPILDPEQINSTNGEEFDAHWDHWPYL